MHFPNYPSVGYRNRDSATWMISRILSHGISPFALKDLMSGRRLSRPYGENNFDTKR
jgi:hypothetical protein